MWFVRNAQRELSDLENAEEEAMLADEEEEALLCVVLSTLGDLRRQLV